MVDAKIKNEIMSNIEENIKREEQKFKRALEDTILTTLEELLKSKSSKVQLVHETWKIKKDYGTYYYDVRGYIIDPSEVDILYTKFEHLGIKYQIFYIIVGYVDDQFGIFLYTRYELPEHSMEEFEDIITIQDYIRMVGI